MDVIRLTAFFIIMDVKGGGSGESEAATSGRLHKMAYGIF